MSFPHKLLEAWFLENQRELPWRKEKSAYRVWISEVMLQQTRAASAIPYFLRFMELFPNVKALYMAPLEKVIKAWEGLGYYSRARNLHESAKRIVENFGGEIPSTYEELSSLPGFGPYTVGAVLSFAFQKRAAAVDGNVLRVLSRYLCLEEDISTPRVRKKIEEKAEAILDPQTPWITAEALIELGATICAPTPRCEMCPLRSSCKGFSEGKALYLPLKKKQLPPTELFRAVFVLECDGEVLVRREEARKVMAGLYEFPYLETSRLEAIRALPDQIGLGNPIFISSLPPLSHTFTRYKAHLFPKRFRSEKIAIAGWEWVSLKSLSEIPFSSGHRKIVSQLK